ncbi:MAG: ATP-binding protein [Candidatus Diapherotrites archaeon]|nr:ATP-binding protein [Candidatus Diapherotrites archaeon]
MKRITVLSGKGGVGKSSIAASLAIALSKEHKIICADCDVDASNLALVVGLREKDFEQWKKISTNEKAILDEKKCRGCRKCVDVCHFNAISWNKEKKQPVFDRFSCEGCGVCQIVCPNKAIELKQVKNAKIGFGKTKYGFYVVSGQLEMGESGSGKVVAEVKKLAEEKSGKADLMIIDAAAGIGCPVIASVVGSDYVVGVTEPTPSGLSDLKRALQMVNHFGIPYGIVINKHDLNPKFTKEVEKFAEENGTEVLAKIPYNKGFADALVNLVPVIIYSPKTKKFFEDIASKIPKN